MNKPMAPKKRNGDIAERKSGPEVAPGKASSPIQVGRGGLFVWALVLIACAGIAAGTYFWKGPATPAIASAEASVAIGGPFHLTDQNGKVVDQHVLDGKWSAVFFGYTYCPDVCPATLQALGAASRQLGAANAFQTVFITVDPARDTPAQMKTYLESQGFPAHVVGLTGTQVQIAQVAKGYGVYYAKSGTGAYYTVDHAAAVYLMDPHGKFARPLSHDMAPTLIAQQIKAAQATG